MKKICTILFTFLLAAALFAGCSQGGGGAVLEKIEISEREIMLYEGDSKQLSATLTPEGTEAEIEWTTENAAVATVSEDGTVSAVAAGSTTVTASAAGKSASCEVTVVTDAEEKREGFVYYEDFDNRPGIPSYLNAETSGDGEAAIENGSLKFRVGASGKAEAGYTFEEALSGTYVVEARVKAESSNFANALFLCTEGGNKVACLGMDACGFRSNDGTGWSATIARYETGKWYDIRMVIDTESEEYDLYVGSDRYAGQPFSGVGEIKELKIGCDKPNTGIEYDSIRVYDGETRLFPVIDAEKTEYVASKDEQTSVTLEYEVIGTPEPEVQLICDRAGAEIAADNKTVTFTTEAEAGIYKFTVRAENAVSVTEKEFTVNLRAEERVIFDEDFETDEIPYGMKLSASLFGAATIEDGALHLTTAEAGLSPYTTAAYDFIEPLTGKIVVETRIKNNSPGSDHFANVLFLYRSDATEGNPDQCTASVAIEKNNLQYHTGSGWRVITAVENGAWLDLEITLDFDSCKMDVKLNGASVLTNAAFRNASFADDTSKMFIGSTKSGCDIAYDYLRFLRAE